MDKSDGMLQAELEKQLEVAKGTLEEFEKEIVRKCEVANDKKLADIKTEVNQLRKLVKQQITVFIIVLIIIISIFVFILFLC